MLINILFKQNKTNQYIKIIVSLLIYTVYHTTHAIIKRFRHFRNDTDSSINYRNESQRFKESFQHLQ